MCDLYILKYLGVYGKAPVSLQEKIEKITILWQ